MGGIERIGDLYSQVKQQWQWQWVVGNALPQSRAIQILHRDKALVLRLADFVNHADVGMIEAGGGPRFPAEPFQHRGVFCDQLGQEFESHHPAQLNVLGLVHNAHTPAAQLLDDAIVRNGLADHAQACYGGSVGKSMKAVELEDLKKVVGEKSLFHSLPCSCGELCVL